VYHYRRFIVRLLYSLRPPPSQVEPCLIFDLDRARKISNNILAGLVTATRCPRRYRSPAGTLERFYYLDLGGVTFTSRARARH